MARSLKALLGIFGILEANRVYQNTHPKGEPQLGRRGLYRAMGGLPEAGKLELAMLWVLNESDGTKSLLNIATRSNISFSLIAEVAELLKENSLVA